MLEVRIKHKSVLQTNQISVKKVYACLKKNHSVIIKEISSKLSGYLLKLNLIDSSWL